VGIVVEQNIFENEKENKFVGKGGLNHLKVIILQS
jgi:hypothetical protein